MNFYALMTAVPAQWDLGNFLDNAKEQITEWGGSLLMLLGAVAVIWGGVQLVRKLMASPQTAGQQSGWGTIALLIVVGGALFLGGWQLMATVSSGGEQTVRDLGSSALVGLHLIGR